MSCTCGHAEEEHGPEPGFPGSTACHGDDNDLCGCVAFEDDGSEDLVDDAASPLLTSSASHQSDIQARKTALGGNGLLTDADVQALGAGVLRVYKLMQDGLWHGPEEICRIAGENGHSAREGLRRMRELRKWFAVERKRAEDGSRLWFYRLVPPVATEGVLAP